MARVVGSIVVKNEADRYLEKALSNALSYLDEIFVYDDRSDDESAEIALSLGCRTVRRPEDKPSFMEHEGEFRQSAWNAFVRVMGLREGDWVFSFDADEFLVADDRSFEAAISSALQRNASGVIIPIPEIFEVNEEGLFARQDGFWGQIRGSRLFPFRHFGFFEDKSMGCGSEPTYVRNGYLSNQNYGITLLHLGYAREEDRVAKYERYSSLPDHGHNSDHIESILKPPVLRKWEGKVPEVLGVQQ